MAKRRYPTTPRRILQVPSAILFAADPESARKVLLRACERAKAPLAIAAIKEIATSTGALSEQAAFALLRSGKLEHYERMLRSDDFLEGARAFNEKRPPVWRGR
jgi:enoyl-CoA hydratase/carnithine racemase